MVLFPFLIPNSALRCQASCLPGDESTCSYLQVAACCPRKRGSSHPWAVRRFTRNFHHGQLGFPLVPHSFCHLQVTVTLSPDVLVLHQLLLPRAEPGEWEARSSPVAWQPLLGALEQLELCIDAAACIPHCPDSRAYPPFQHWHSPNPQPGLAAV